MIKELKFIFVSIFKTLVHDFKSVYDDFSRPKEIMNVLFWLALIMIFVKEYITALILYLLYLIVYIWKIIRQGEWRHIMRIDSKK